MKAAEREFGLLGRQRPVTAYQPALHVAVAGREAAGREFGIEPSGG